MILLIELLATETLVLNPELNPLVNCVPICLPLLIAFEQACVMELMIIFIADWTMLDADTNELPIALADADIPVNTPATDEKTPWIILPIVDNVIIDDVTAEKAGTVVNKLVENV